MTLIKAERLSKAESVPVTAEVALVPVAVKVWTWVPSAAPVKVSAEVTLDEPEKVGTPTGHESVWVWTDPAPLVTEEPVKVSAEVTLDEPLRVGTPAGHAIVPTGVPALTA